MVWCLQSYCKHSLNYIQGIKLFVIALSTKIEFALGLSHFQ